jgi:hypothetical protein
MLKKEASKMKKIELTQSERHQFLTSNLDLELPGIEISPLFRPTVKKSESQVFYVDVCTADESRQKHKHYQHDPILEIDVLWKPGEQLKKCVPPSSLFNWAIASHVLEHVPDPLGWINQILEILPIGGILSLALPRKEYCFDKFRNDTTTAELIEAWIQKYQVPSSRQIYDFISKSVSNGYIREDSDGFVNFLDCERSYSDIEAFAFVKRIFQNEEYLDAHCSVFNPKTITQIFDDLTKLGIVNVKCWLPSQTEECEEFFVCIQKMGEPIEAIPNKSLPLFDSHQNDKKYFKRKIFLIRNLLEKAEFFLLK